MRLSTSHEHRHANLACVTSRTRRHVTMNEGRVWNGYGTCEKPSGGPLSLTTHLSLLLPLPSRGAGALLSFFFYRWYICSSFFGTEILSFVRVFVWAGHGWSGRGASRSRKQSTHSTLTLKIVCLFAFSAEDLADLAIFDLLSMLTSKSENLFENAYSTELEHVTPLTTHKTHVLSCITGSIKLLGPRWPKGRGRGRKYGQVAARRGGAGEKDFYTFNGQQCGWLWGASWPGGEARLEGKQEACGQEEEEIKTKMGHEFRKRFKIYIYLILVRGYWCEGTWGLKYSSKREYALRCQEIHMLAWHIHKLEE